MNLMINKLPSITWNKLKMNGAAISVEGNFANHSPRAEGISKEVNYSVNPSGWEGLTGDLEAFTAEAEIHCAEVKAGIKMEAPLVLTYDYAENEQGISRLLLKAGENAHLKVIVILTSPMGSKITSALQTKIYAEENAVLDYYVVQLLGDQTLCLNAIAGYETEKAQIHLTKLELGAQKTYAGANIDLRGRESAFSNEIGYHVKNGQVLDMNYVALHEGKRTLSNMEVNGTLEEGARKIFRGTIDFRQGCAGAKAAENENVMLMGDQMVNQTIPVILCKEEDVEGNHGASIGQLDDQILFYLGTRGISQEAAQQLIAQARIDAVCEKIPVEAVRAQVREFEEVRGISHGEKF